jgi:nitroreductase
MKDTNDASNSIYNVILSRRSIRRFQQEYVDINILKKIVNAGRLAPSAANLQPLEYFIVNEKKLCSKIFETIGWAGYIKPKWAPVKKERPTAYIIILVTDIKNKYYKRDTGFATENIILAAEGENIGSCVLCNIDRDKIRDILKIPEILDIDSLIALGYKAEQPVVENMKNSVKYWRDKNMVLHVPKRKLEDILHINVY